MGDIEDEYDFDENEDNIIIESKGRYRIKATTEIDNFNEVLGAKFNNEDCDTIGGLVLKEFGRLPKHDEFVTINGFKFRVLRADSRRLYILQVEKIEQSAVS